MALHLTGSIGVSDSITSTHFSGSMSGSFQGDGSGLTGISGTTTINTTNNAIPIRSDATTFVDSVITQVAGASSTIYTIAASFTMVADNAASTVVITDPNTTIVEVGDTVAFPSGLGSGGGGFGGAIFLSSSTTGTVTNVTGNE